MLRTPDQTAEKTSDPRMEEMESKLTDEYRKWRRLLQKSNMTRVKICTALDRAGNHEAAELIGEEPRLPLEGRCGRCPGCLVKEREQDCGACRGCQEDRGCGEYHRRCHRWSRALANFYAGSQATSISSQFDVAVGDLRKYQAIVAQIREQTLEVEDLASQFPTGSEVKKNPRYAARNLNKTVADEEVFLAKLEAIVAGHLEQLQRLDDFDDEEVEEETELELDGGESVAGAERQEEESVLTGTGIHRRLAASFQDLQDRRADAGIPVLEDATAQEFLGLGVGEGAGLYQVQHLDNQIPRDLNQDQASHTEGGGLPTPPLPPEGDLRGTPATGGSKADEKKPEEARGDKTQEKTVG